MRSSRTLCRLLAGNGCRTRIGLSGVQQPRAISTPATSTSLGNHEVHGRRSPTCLAGSTVTAPASRYVHSSGTWPNTQPHVLNGDGELYQLTSVEHLRSWFEKRKKEVYDDLMSRQTNPHAVFTNSELSLKYTDVYGFDFDCTLVHYTSEVHRLIYELAKDRLVEHNEYPSGIKGLTFDPDFAIRGLHCDIKNGYLMKIDAYNHIQLSSVYRGHSPVEPEEVLKYYGGTHVPMHVMDSAPSGSKWKLTQFLDNFSIPEATLFADVLEYLISQSDRFYPEHLFEDVQRSVFEVHNSRQIHKAICSDLDRYLEGTPRLCEFLSRLKSAGKKTFIITNSPYWFVNEGMTHVVGTSDWRDLLDVVITEARKPSFYSDSTRPFRCLNSDLKAPTWSKVDKFEAGQVYQQGNINDFIKMTQWGGGRVLYFGDHVFTDLADPLLQHGWKTGAIIPELEDEIAQSNESRFKENLAEVLTVENLLQKRQHFEDPEVAALVEEWKGERNDSRRYLKESHNLRFGSVFRTEKSPTYFSRRLATFSNLYTSSLDNLMNYSLTYTFIPRRQSLPHEPDLNFDY